MENVGFIIHQKKSILIPVNNIVFLGNNIYSNKKETSDFHGTVSFDPVKLSQQK